VSRLASSHPALAGRLAVVTCLVLLAPAAARAQQLSLVTATPGGGSAGHVSSSGLAMTPDEQYVAFCSSANSLDPTKPDTNGIADVYRRHLPTGITSLVSVDAAGTGPGNGACDSSANVRISADGRYVAFTSQATNLVSGVTDAASGGIAVDLFVRDMQTGTTVVASVNAAGTQTVGTNGIFELSDDGHRVVFESYATTLVAGFVDHNGAGFTDVFLRDLQTGVTELVSASQLGPTHGGNAPSFLGNGQNLHTMSADGRYVAFESPATDILAAPGAGTDLYVRDVQANTTVLGDDDNPTGVYGLTADGRWLVFSVDSQQIWVRDLQTNARIQVSVNAANTGSGNNVSPLGFISRLPRTPGQQDYVVAFHSLATDLVNGVTKANGPGAPTIYARTLGGSTVLVGGIPNGTATGNGQDFLRDISPDGRYVAFISTSTDLVAGVTDTAVYDQFRRDLVTGTTAIVSVAQPSGTTGGGSGMARVGQTGGVIFDTDQLLLPADTGFAVDIYFFGVIPSPSISGTVTASNGGAPLAGVTLTLAGTTGGTTTTSGAGTYSFATLTANGSYTVTPSLAGFTFAPVSRSVVNLLGAQTADFVGTAAGPTLYTISGQVRDLNDTGVVGVTMTISGSASGTLQTDLDGRYAFSGLAPGGTYTITPSKSTFSFTPPAQTFPNLQRDEVAAFFVANVGTFTRYFAEGATGGFFDTTIALLNATGQTVDVTVRFLEEDGTSTQKQLTMPGLARATVDPELLPGTEAASFSTVITSTQPIIADRRM
jgi:Tol biopolymer transport system component